MAQAFSTDRPRLIVALDFPDPRAAIQLAERLDPELCRLKVGKELFLRAGPKLVEKLMTQDYSVFLDLKFHDIPNTVAGACRAAAELGVWMINVHALGGSRMMIAAREAIEASRQRPLLIAVSVLTSLSTADLHELGIPMAPEACVLRWARLAERCGLDGMVCSAAEAPVIRDHLGQEPILVTPGVRQRGAAANDQHRVVTPGEALALGADYLVMGRPITQSQDPRRAILAINSEISAGDSRRPLLS
jgi:orotidine-5'-phosphate decarboxylase